MDNDTHSSIYFDTGTVESIRTLSVRDVLSISENIIMKLTSLYKPLEFQHTDPKLSQLKDAVHELKAFLGLESVVTYLHPKFYILSDEDIELEFAFLIYDVFGYSLKYLYGRQPAVAIHKTLMSGMVLDIIVKQMREMFSKKHYLFRTTGRIVYMARIDGRGY
jgi:hypothetical protein